MSTSASWLRHSLAWSNSRQSWMERACGLALLLAAFLTWNYSSDLSMGAALSLWALLVLGTAILLRRGWLKLFGPVLFYDMVRSARRGRYFLLRVLYAGLLTFVLLTVYADSIFLGSDHHQASILALQFFEAFMLVQIVTVHILTPAFVAGAIAEEKDRKTMEFLLATDLRNREIVLSKFGARLANLTLLLLTGLPILSLIQFLGGVDPTLVLSGFAATGMVALGLAGLSTLNSVLFKRPRDAIAITYLYLISYIALGLVAYGFQASGVIARIDFPIWFGAGAPTLNSLIDWLNSGNILLAIGKVGGLGSGVAFAVLEEFAIFHGILALVCLTWSVVRVRKVALRQAFASVAKAGARIRARAPVGELPMLWKEISVEGGVRFNWVAFIILGLLFLVTMIFPVWMLIDYALEPHSRLGRDDLAREVNVWVRLAGTFVASLTVLSVAVRASSSIGIERDKQTLDVLLTTPMDSGSILWAKFLGTLLGVRLAWVWLAIIWGIGLLTGGLHIFALPLVLGAWVVYASFFVVLGLWFSMTAKTTMRATVYTVLCTIMLSVGHWLVWLCCGPLLLLAGPGSVGEVSDYLSKFQLGMTPPFSMAFLSFTSEDFAEEFIAREFAPYIGFSILGLFIWGIAAIIFGLAVLAPRFRVFTGREEERYPESDFEPRRRPDKVTR